MTQDEVHQHPKSPEPVIGLEVDGKYRLLDRIGRGGMGEVWKAQSVQSGVDDHVAIKFYSPAPDPLADKYARDAFNRELQLLRRLRSQHIVEVRDQGVMADRPYFVMKLLDGHTLEAHIFKHQRLPWREALRLIGEMARALMHLHQLDYVHRDLKPSNIFLQTSGSLVEPYLLDFGIAAPVGGHDDGGFKTSILGEHASVGTPEYSAPEQLTGGFVPATDLYALGVIAYRMLAGRLPFDVPRALQPHAHMFDSPPAIENSEIPDDVKRLVFELLEKDPARRPPSAKDLHDRIARLVATDFTLISTYVQRPRRRMLPIVMAALFVASVTVGAMIASESNLLFGPPIPLQSSPRPIPTVIPLPSTPTPSSGGDPAPPPDFVALDELGNEAAAIYRRFEDGDLPHLRNQLQKRVAKTPTASVVAALSIIESKLGRCLSALGNIDRFDRLCPDCESRTRTWPLLQQARDRCLGELTVVPKPAGTTFEIVRVGVSRDGRSTEVVAPFRRTRIPAGRYRITAHKPGCQPMILFATVTAGVGSTAVVEPNCDSARPETDPQAPPSDTPEPIEPPLPDSTPLGHLPFPSDDDR